MTLYQDIQNALVSITKISDDEIKAEFSFHPEAHVFLGHFPGRPIVPGIMQIEMTRFSVEQSRNKNYKIQSIRKTKFSELIKPEDKITIAITLYDSGESGEILNIKAVLKANNKPAGKTNLTLVEV